MLAVEGELELMPVRVIGPGDDPIGAYRVGDAQLDLTEVDPLELSVGTYHGKSMVAVRVGEWTILRAWGDPE